jgi:hypothetical protein
MIHISPWTAKYETEMICSHVATVGQQAYKLTIPVCREHVACLPQALKAALQQERPVTQQPSLLYRLWHKCFGTRPKPNALNQGTYERMRKWTAKQAVRLDCGHTVRQGAPVWQGQFYVCQHESNWRLAVLAVCAFVLRQEQAAPQPRPGLKTKPDTTGLHQPSA